MADSSNPEHISHNEITDNFFPNNNEFDGYDQQELSFDPNWSYPSDHINVGQVVPATFPQPSWQHVAQTNSLAPSPDYAHHDDLYGRPYPSTTNSFNVAASEVVGGFNLYQREPYNSATIPSSIVTDENQAFSEPLNSNQSQARTIAPEALQNVKVPWVDPVVGSSQSQAAFVLLPKGRVLGDFIVTSAAELKKVANVQALHNFVDIGSDAQDVWITKSTIPSYHPRRSRSEIRTLLACDSRLTAKLSKSTSRPTGSKAQIGNARSNVPTSSSLGSTKRQALEPSTEEESSQHESMSESSEEEIAIPPIPATRPTSAVDAVKYDTIKALWYPPTRTVTKDEIGKSLGDFWEVVRTIRDRWKSDVAAVKEAEDAKKVHDVPLLKERVTKQREMLETALKSALHFGHHDVVEHFAENGAFILLLAQFLVDRAKELDYSGELPLTILEILSRCKTMTDARLDKCSVKKVLPRFAKRGDDKIKLLVKRVESNAVTVSRKQKESSVSSTATPVQARDIRTSANQVRLAGSTVSGVKRPHALDKNAESAKRVAPNPGNGASGTTTHAKGMIADKPATPASPHGARKVSQVIAKPSGFFSGLTAYKKSTTPNTPAAATVNKVTSHSGAVERQSAMSATSTAVQQKAGIFAETITNLTKPKELEGPAKREAAGPPETEVEMTKRLRKEQRRKLHVTFKPDNALVDIRFFTHDPEEELGHDASQVRDVGDTESEGRMFKKQHHLSQDAMDIDDEDECEESLAVGFKRSYLPPSVIDFSDIDQADRERNYEPYGGGIQKPESPEHDIQKRREASTLMAVYSVSADIPPSPKEPPAEPVNDSLPPRDFGVPPDHVLSRLASVARPSQLLPDLSGILGTIASQMSQQPTQQVAVQTPMTELEKIFAQHAKPVQQQQMPILTNLQPTQAPDVQAILASIAQQNQTALLQPYQHPLQANTGPPDITSILASLQQPTQLPQAPGMPQMMGTSLNQFAQAGYPQGQQGYGQQLQQNQPYTFENPERRRWIESGKAEINDSNDQSGFRQGLQNAGSQNKTPWNKPKSKNPPMFVVQCKYWKDGKCKKGADCTFLHD